MAIIAIWQIIPYNTLMNWNVYFSEKAAKQAKKLNKMVISIGFVA
jgi:hypothetical protein